MLLAWTLVLEVGVCVSRLDRFQDSDRQEKMHGAVGMLDMLLFKGCDTCMLQAACLPACCTACPCVSVHITCPSAGSPNSLVYTTCT